MRTFALFLVLVVLVPLAIFKPWIGVLGWTWISTMNPHKLTFGLLFDFPIAALVAGATLLGLLLTRDRRWPPLCGPTLTLAAFVAWMCFTSLFALYPSEIGGMFNKVMKIQFMVFVTMMLLYTRTHLAAFIWVVGLSLAFYGFKGGFYTIATGGEGRVWGPPGGFIEGNNEIGLALVMTIPILVYLWRQSSSRLLRYLLLLTMFLSALSILGTQSRGAFLAIIAMSIYLWLLGRRKILLGSLLVVAAIGLVAFMPGSWEERMQSIVNYQSDRSAMGRLNAWQMAINLANDRFIGGGFEVTTPELFAKYAPEPRAVHAAHSIYFQVLGEHGYLGLLLFLAIWFFVWREGWRLTRLGRELGIDDLAEVGIMIRVSLVGYLAGGAFLSLAYFDLPYNLLIMAVIARGLIRESREEVLRAGESSSGGVDAPLRSGEMTAASSEVTLLETDWEQRDRATGLQHRSARLASPDERA